MTDSNERKLKNSPNAKPQSVISSFNQSTSGNPMRKSPDARTESGSSSVMNSSKGNNVPWGKANDRRKVSSKMF